MWQSVLTIDLQDFDAGCIFNLQAHKTEVQKSASGAELENSRIFFLTFWKGASNLGPSSVEVSFEDQHKPIHKLCRCIP